MPMQDRHKHDPLMLHRTASRAVVCVNACAGMADPAVEIAAMREAIREACEALNAWKRTGSGMSTDFTLQSNAFRTGQVALAKLQPFLK